MDELEEKLPETPAEMPETTPEIAPKPRHPFYDRIKSMHPDREFADDNEYLSAADEKMTEHEGYRSQNEEANKIVIEALFAEPRFAGVLNDIFEGADAIEALALHFSPEELQSAAQESNPDKWPEKKAARDQSRKEYQDWIGAVNANSEASQSTIGAWSERRGLDPEVVTDFVQNTVNAFLDDVYKGKITESLLDNLWEAKTKPADLEEAAATAEIKGRNANIEELTAKENGQQGDGLPAIASMGSMPEAPKPVKPKNDLEEIAEYSAKTRGR